MDEQAPKRQKVENKARALDKLRLLEEKKRVELQQLIDERTAFETGAYLVRGQLRDRIQMVDLTFDQFMASLPPPLSPKKFRAQATVSEEDLNCLQIWLMMYGRHYDKDSKPWMDKGYCWHNREVVKLSIGYGLDLMTSGQLAISAIHFFNEDTSVYGDLVTELTPLGINLGPTAYVDFHGLSRAPKLTSSRPAFKRIFSLLMHQLDTKTKVEAMLNLAQTSLNEKAEALRMELVNIKNYWLDLRCGSTDDDKEFVWRLRVLQPNPQSQDRLRVNHPHFDPVTRLKIDHLETS